LFCGIIIRQETPKGKEDEANEKVGNPCDSILNRKKRQEDDDIQFNESAIEDSAETA